MPKGAKPLRDKGDGKVSSLSLSFCFFFVGQVLLGFFFYIEVRLETEISPILHM
jgi:hypothetical protein